MKLPCLRLPRTRIIALLFPLLAAGCVSTSRNEVTEMSDEIRKLTELRDTCMQYAGWMGRELKNDSPEYRRGVQLYIDASSTANSYIETIQFDIVAGLPFSNERYTNVASRVQKNTGAFLDHARESLRIEKSRGLPVLLIPAALGLVDLASKIGALSRAASERQRELLSKALEDKKWKRFQELVP